MQGSPTFSGWELHSKNKTSRELLLLFFFIYFLQCIYLAHLNIIICWPLTFVCCLGLWDPFSVFTKRKCFRLNNFNLFRSVHCAYSQTCKSCYTPSRFSASIDVDRCRAVDERRVALLRLVCTAPSCLFGRADTFRRRFDMLNREAVGQINHSDWLFSLANQCMRSETEVRDPNKLLRRQIWDFI